MAVVLVSGRPLVVEDELQASDAFVAAWLPGSEGDGVADVLFGEAQFEGRLPLPWPSSQVEGAQVSEYSVRFPAGFGLTMSGSRLSAVDNVVSVNYKNQAAK